MQVLLVENSVTLQTSLGSGLRKLGYAIDIVADGVEAIARASSRDYDIIILDLILPKESSLLILHEIRESDRDVEILILSTRDQIHDRVTALIQGADDYLVKPFSLDDLHARIQELVRRKSAELAPSAEADDPSSRSPRYLDRLIANLLRLCANERGDIELVISEVKLAVLLRKVSLGLRLKASEHGVTLRLPSDRLPKLLIDAKWMEHLLSNLVFNAISLSQPGTEINLRVQPGEEHCAIEIESAFSQTFDLSLIESCAAYLNLQVGVCVTPDKRSIIRLSNLKMV